MRWAYGRAFQVVFDEKIMLFALDATGQLGARVARSMKTPLLPHEERDFEDGEHKARPLVNVRGRDVAVIHSLYGDRTQSVNDKLCRLLFFIGALKDAAAARVIAVIPYLCYARKDRKTKPRDPVTTRYLASLLEAVGSDCVVTVDVHNLVAFQNAFRCHNEHLEAQGLFASHLLNTLGDAEIVVVSPDVGGIKRAERLRENLARRLEREVGTAFMEKHRSGGEVWGEALVGSVRDTSVVLVDDLISTGGTLVRAARACKAQGAHSVHALATHGLFVGRANDTLADASLDKIVITNTVAPFRLEAQAVRAKVTTLDIAPLVAQSLQRIHHNGSIVALMEAEADLTEAVVLGATTTENQG